MPLYNPTENDRKVADSTIPEVAGQFTKEAINIEPTKATVSPTLTKESMKSDFLKDPIESVRENEVARKQEIERRVKVNNANLGQKIDAMGEAFSDNTLSHVIDWVRYDVLIGDEDREFISTLNEDTVKEVMRANGLSSNKTYNDLIESKNSYQFSAKLQLAMEREKRDKEIANTLTNLEKISASLAGDLLTDPTVYLTGGIGIVSKLEKVRSALSTVRAGATAGLVGSEIGYGSMVAMSEDDFDGIDAMLFYSIPAAVDGVLLGRTLSKMDKAVVSKETSLTVKEADKMVETPKEIDINTIDNMEKEIVKVETKQSLNDLAKQYKTELATETDKLKRLKEEIETISKMDKKGKNPLWLQKRKSIIDTEKRVKELDKLIKNTERLLEYKSTIKRIKSSKAYKLFKERQVTVKNVERVFKRIETTKVAPYYKKNVALKAYDNIRNIVKADVSNIASDVNEVMKLVSDTKVSDATKLKLSNGITDFLHTTGVLSKTAYKKAKKGKMPKIDVKVTDKGTELYVNGRKAKKAPIIIGAGLVGSSLMAGENDTLNDIFNTLPIMIAGLILTVMFGKPILKSMGNLANTFKDGAKINQKAKALMSTTELRAKIEEGMSAVRTQFTETVEPVKKATSGKLREFADTLYYDPINNIGGSIERAKTNFVRRYFNSYLKETNDIFFEWLKANNKSKMDYVLSIFSGRSLKDEFKTMVTLYRTEGKFADIPEVVKASKVVDEYFKSMADEFIANGLKGAEKLQDGGIEKYVPRLMRVEELRGLLAYANAESRTKMIEHFAEMITANYSYEKKIEIAAAYLEGMLDSTFAMNLAKKDKKRVLNGLVSRGIPEDVAKDIVDSMMGEASRLKYRLGLDYTKFKPLELVYEDGTKVKLTIEDIFEHNMDNIMSRYINMMAGHNALAIHGYKSLDEAINVVIHGAGKQWAKDVILQDLLTIAGQPQVDYSNVANIAARGAANIAVGSKMMLSTLTLMGELFIYGSYVLKNNGVFKGMKKISDSLLNNFGKDAFVTKAHAFGKDGMGIGTHRYTGSYGQMKRYDEVGNIDSQIGNRGLRATEIFRDFTLFTLPFVKTSDFLQRLNLQDILDTLYYHLKSNKKVLNAYELEALPNISDGLKSYLKAEMKLNDKNRVKWFDLDKMPLHLKNEFRELVDALLLKRMNDTTFGTSAPFSRHTALGIAMMPMLKYGMTAFSNLGIYDLRGSLRGDIHSVMRTMLWFQAGMLQTQLRYAITGKEEPDEKTLIINGFLNMPIMGSYSLFTSLGDSPTEQVIRDMIHTIDLYEVTR